MSFVDQIIQVESGGNPNAKNPRSTATGPGQFIESTWLNTISKYRPDLTTGRTKEEILALRTDPSVSRQMTEALAAENAAGLTKAGFPATPGNTYLAHFAGPQGAISALSASPATPVSEILGPAAMKANPFLANMTAADLTAWANNKMGTPQGAANIGPSNLSMPTQLNQGIVPTVAPDQSTPNQAPMMAQDPMQNPQLMMRYLSQFDQSPQMPPTLGIEPQQRPRTSGPFRGAFSFGKR